MNIIELKEITKTYKRGEEDLHVLRNISLSVAEGDFVAIIGPSGSGKSTLMNTIGLVGCPDFRQLYAGWRCDGKYGPIMRLLSCETRKSALFFNNLICCPDYQLWKMWSFR